VEIGKNSEKSAKYDDLAGLGVILDHFGLIRDRKFFLVFFDPHGSHVESQAGPSEGSRGTCGGVLET